MIKILAIDDSRTMRELIKATLTEAGFLVTTADDGVDGLEKFKEVEPDVVITDVNMPNLDGFGVIDGIRGGDHLRSVPILVLTTESSDKMKQRAKTAGATGWIVKPFEETSLLKIINRVSGGV